MITFSNSIKVPALPDWKCGATCFRGLAIFGFVVCPGESPIKHLPANNAHMFLWIPHFWQERVKETYSQTA
jgi:hypothetical protein